MHLIKSFKNLPTQAINNVVVVIFFMYPGLRSCEVLTGVNMNKSRIHESKLIY